MSGWQTGGWNEQAAPAAPAAASGVVEKYDQELAKDDDEVHIVSKHEGLERWSTWDDCKKQMPPMLVDVMTDGTVASFEKPSQIQAWRYQSNRAYG